VKLELLRFLRTPIVTVGFLYVDGHPQCFTLEDTVRADGVKVPGATAIPAGTYDVQVTHSPKFGVDMPMVMGVPGFQGIRIHPGNSKDDTEGCILVGRHVLHTSTSGEYVVTESRAAYSELFPLIQKATHCTLTIIEH